MSSEKRRDPRAGNAGATYLTPNDVTYSSNSSEETHQSETSVIPDLDIFTAPRKDSKTWTAGTISWDELKARGGSPDDKKECGGYVLGRFKGTHRTKGDLLDRCALTLDADDPDATFLDRVRAELDGTAAIIHSTFNSTAAKPRYRVIVPLARRATAAEYAATARHLMGRIGQGFDPSCDQPERFMYRPSTQDPEKFHWEPLAGGPLDVVTASETDAQDRSADSAPTPAPVATDMTPYDQLDNERKRQARERTQDRLNGWRARLQAALELDERGTDENGRGWERQAADFAYTLHRLALSSWCHLDEESAEKEFHKRLPQEMADAESGGSPLADKWQSKASGARMDGPLPAPWEEENMTAPVRPAFQSLDGDRDVAEAILPKLGDQLARTPGRGWLSYDAERGIWRSVADSRVLGRVMEAATEWAAEKFKTINDPRQAQKLYKLRDDSKGRKVMSQLETMVLQDDSAFDAHPQLLCVGNGVVDLRTGQLLSHDPALRLTKGTATAYVADAKHDDWNKVLSSLPVEKRDWLRGRFGQGITGRPPTDDRVVFLRSPGSGAKSTLLSALQTALGDHMAKMPDKILTSKGDAHSTEITELQGARLAYIEELPEGARLNVKRLKDLAGTGVMDGRRLYKDTIRWQATHTLFITTNYLPRVVESDKGTWRRLVMCEFPYTYVDRVEEITDPATQRVKDTTLRQRVTDGHGGRAEAALAWIVGGAREWYAAHEEMAPMPASVKQDTDRWRGTEDLISAFAGEYLQFDPEGLVSTRDLYAAFCCWQENNGRQIWAENTFKPRFEQHELIAGHRVESKRVRRAAAVSRAPQGLLTAPQPRGSQVSVYTGVCWKPGEDLD